MKKNLFFFSLLLLVIVFFASPTSAQIQWKIKDLGTKPNDYTVTVTLSDLVNPNSVDTSAIYAENEWFENIPIQTTVKDNKIYISPKTKYKNGSKISIYINSNLLSTSNSALHKPTKIILHIDDLQDPFVPRKDASNNVNFSQTIYKVPSSKIVEVNDTYTNATLKNISSQTLQNVVLYFPTSKENPFGAYRTITKITEQNGNFVLQLTQPNMKTFIDNIDISDEISVDASTFVVNPELQHDGIVIVRNDKQLPKDLLASTVPLSNIKDLLEINVDKDGIEATFKEFPIFDGAVALSGSFQVTDINASIDIKRNSLMDTITSNKDLIELNKIQLFYQEDIQLRTTLKSLSKHGVKETLYLGQIPIPYLGGKGIGLNAFVYLTVDIDGSSKLSITYAPSFDVAIDYPNDQKQYLTITPDAGIDKLTFDFENKAKLSVAATVGVGFLIGDHRLVELNGKLESSLSTQGKLFTDYEKLTNSSYCISNNFTLSTNINIQGDVVFADGRITLANYDLLNLSQGNCEFKSIELLAPTTNLVAGQTEKFDAFGHFVFTKQRIPIPTPSSIVTFTSNNPYVKVSNTGEVKVSEDVPVKQNATITLQVKNPVTDKSTAVKKTITIAPISYFTQGIGYQEGAYAPKALQPTLTNWSQNLLVTGPMTLKRSQGLDFEGAISLPVIDQQKNLYVIGNNGKSILSMKENGTKRWETKFKEEVGYPTLAANDTLYVAVANRVYALNTANGKTLWSTKLEGNIGNVINEYIEHSISLQPDGTLLVPTTTKLNAINKNGILLWSKNVQGPYITNATVHVSSNSNLYYANHETLYGFNTHGGKLWERNFIKQNWYVHNMQLSKAGNPLICTTSGELFEIGLKGETIKSIKLSSCNAIAVSPTGTIYVATNKTIVSLSTDFKRLKQYTFTHEYDAPYMYFQHLLIDAKQNIYVSGTVGSLVANTNPYYIVLDKNLKELKSFEDYTSGTNAKMLIQQNAFYTIEHVPSMGGPYLNKFTY